MKKYLAIFLSFIIIFSAALVAVQVYAADDSDTVEYTEHTISGDRSELEGIRVDLELHCADHLFWNVGYTMGENPTYDVEFEHLYNEPKQNSAPKPQFNITFGFSNWGGSSSGDMLEDDDHLFGQYDMIADVASRTPAGETHKEVVYLHDYYEYYPISFTMSINDASCRENYFHRDSTNFKYDAMFKEIQRKLEEYFKMPVLPDDQREIEVTKRANGTVSSVNTNHAEKSPAIEMYISSIISDSAIYFMFDSVPEDTDEQFDLSEMGDGCGIYRIPYEVTEYDGEYYSSAKTYTNVKIDEMELVYPIEEGVKIEGIQLSDDESVIYLTTRHSGTAEDEIRLSVIDTATMTDIQATTLFTCAADDNVYIKSYHDDFILYKINSEKFAVVEKADGIWRTAFVVADEMIYDLWSSAEFIIQYYNTTEAYDGERLVIAAYSTERGGNGMESAESYLASFYLSVYSAEGNLYTGKFTSTLDTGTFLSYNETCRPTDDSAIRITLP